MDDLRERLFRKDDDYSTQKNYNSVTEKSFAAVQSHIEVDYGETDTEPDIAHYHRRWYVLAVFSLLALGQGAFWNTFGPIAKASEDAFGWTDSDIALLSNWGAIMYVVSAAPMSWLTYSKGLRLAVIVASVLTVMTTGLRCITSTPPTATWLIHIAQILNGFAGPLCCAVPPVLSATWFPSHQRTTATAIAAVSSYLGVGIGFIIGPYMVPESPDSSNNQTNESLAFWDNSKDISLLSNGTSHSDILSQERRDIKRLMYVEAGWAVFILLVILIYFPAKPPKPPSITASIGRLSYRSSIKILVSNRQFWLIGMTYFIPQGVNQCWSSVLDVNLKPHGISQKEAGWLGFYGLVAGTSASLIIARFSDIFSKHVKWFLLGVMVPAAGFYLWFTLIFIDKAPANTASIYSSVILGGLFLMCGPPLFFEMTSEITFPVPEAVSVFLLTLMFNLSGAIFLSIQMIPNIGTAWQNWVNVGCIIACIPLLLLFKESYNRLTIDEAGENKPDS